MSGDNTDAALDDTSQQVGQWWWPAPQDHGRAMDGTDSRVFPPEVEMTGVAVLPLGDGTDRGLVVVGNSQSKVLVGGRSLAVSTDGPVVVRPYGPGVTGGFVTLTLACDRVIIDGREVGDV